MRVGGGKMVPIVFLYKTERRTLKCCLTGSRLDMKVL